MNIPYLMKKCSKCGEWKVASTVNFQRRKDIRCGLASQCKECRKKKQKQYYENHREEIAKHRKQRYEANREKELEQCKQYRQANREKILERHRQYYKDNREKKLEYGKQYRQDNKDKVSERHKRYYQANRDKIAETNKRWYEANKDKILERCKQYRQDNKEKIAKRRKQYYQSPQGQVAIFNGRQRRRIKEEEQGTGITKDQWLEMMKYFDWKCAYSGEYIGGKQNYQRTIDHIVPISTGGDNMIWNLVPMTKSLNSSKHANNMEEWYKEQECYDPKRLQKIYEWQEYAYNKYGKDSEYFNTNDIQIKLL